VTFRYCCGPAFAGIDNLNASPVPPEINRSKKAGGSAAYDKTILVQRFTRGNPGRGRLR
jgi:hypothetical protein